MKLNRPFLLVALAALGLPGCAGLDEFLTDLDSGPDVVYVQAPSRPAYFDPYYNQPKIYRQPQYFYEETTKKKKGDKVTKTKTIRNEWGDTVYKEKTTKSKKKKKN